MAEKYLSYYDEFAKEDQEHIVTICETASKTIWERFHARFDDPKLLAATFSKIYSAFINALESMESEHPTMSINICGRLEIGYTTNENEDDEKLGNFMVFIRDLNSEKRNENATDPTLKAVELATLWNVDNIIENPGILRKIAVDACDMLKTIDVNIGSSELVMPIFVTVYEAIVNYLKIRRHEKNDFEFEINFMSCFFIGARESDDDIDTIYIRPNIEAKLQLKNDTAASSKYE